MIQVRTRELTTLESLRMNFQLIFLVLIVPLAKASYYSRRQRDKLAYCDLSDPSGTNDISGRMWLYQGYRMKFVHVTGQIYGSSLSPGLHGFHVHENGDFGNNCANAGGHYNPEGVNHGGPYDAVRHVGDLGNIYAASSGSDGVANVNLYDRFLDLIGFCHSYSIIGRAMVLHAGEDDLGQGGNAGSLSSGNAGARLACCTIREA